MCQHCNLPSEQFYVTSKLDLMEFRAKHILSISNISNSQVAHCFHPFCSSVLLFKFLSQAQQGIPDPKFFHGKLLGEGHLIGLAEVRRLQVPPPPFGLTLSIDPSATLFSTHPTPANLRNLRTAQLAPKPTSFAFPLSFFSLFFSPTGKKIEKLRFSVSVVVPISRTGFFTSADFREYFFSPGFEPRSIDSTRPRTRKSIPSKIDSSSGKANFKL